MMVPNLQDLFTVDLGGTSRAVGGVPGGIKVDVEYLPQLSKITPGSSSGQTFAGTVLSGQDWITVCENGVADFSGRLTLKFGAVLVGAHLTGRADLATVYPSPTPAVTPENAYQLWQNGFPAGSKLKVAASLTFEVAEGAPRALRELDRSLCLGIATVTFTNASFSPIQCIELEVSKIVP